LVKLPEPPSPAELAARVAPEVRTLVAGTELWRVYFRAGRHAMAWSWLRAFGPVPGGRFDPHLPPPHAQARAVLYAALEGPTCLAEVFQDGRTIDLRRNEPWLVAFALAAPLSLLDLTGAWPTRAGASMALASGPRPRAQRWARAIYEAWPGLQGIYYPSCMHANRPAVALFERATGALPERPVFHRALADPPLLAPISAAAAQLGYAVA
jgi:hypothetical protein